MKTINEWAIAVHQNAKDHGWYDGEVASKSDVSDKLKRHMLIVSEVAEATESVRKGEDHLWFGDGGKPEGEASELADVVIRVLDYCQFYGIDIEQAIFLKHEYNKTRPYRHGGKAA